MPDTTMGSIRPVPLAILSSVPKTKQSQPKPSSIDIVIEPREVIFNGIELGYHYIGRVTVKNVGKVTHRIRFSEPTFKDFVINHEGSVNVAPGLDVFASIELRPKEDKDYQDSIFVVCDNDKIEVPLKGCRASPDIQFDGFLNFGMTVLGVPNVRYIDLKNNGLKTGHFSFSYDQSLPIRIVPQSDTIEPDRFSKIKVEFVGVELGPFRCLVNVDLDGQPPRILDVNANVVEQKVELVFPNGGGPCNAIHFGTLYFGQTRTVEALLINNGPLKRSFLTQTTLPPAENGRTSVDAADDESVQEAPNDVISCTPVQGVLQPYSRMSIEFKFCPKDLEEGFTGFKSSAVDVMKTKSETFAMMTIIETIEDPQQIRVDLSGKAIKPNVSISESNLRFGDCPVHDHSDIAVLLKNLSDELPIDFSILRVANFKTQPTEGRLQPLQSMPIKVTFSPNQFGKFKSVLQLVICKGLEDIQLRVSGTSTMEGPKRKVIGGPAATDKDFVREPKYAKSGDLQITEIDPKVFKRKDLIEDAAIADMALDSKYGIPPEEYTRRKEHKEKYGSYLRQAREAREEKARLADATFTDPFGVDLGMEPGNGLIEPEIRLNKIVEPLWIARPSEEEVMPRTKEHVYDENRLFKKKFKPKPTSTTEMRECKLVLTPKELANISFGPKTLDFGTVCVHTLTSKSFSVTNYLKQHIMVAVHATDHEDLKRSAPDSQVIPPGATAGFDVTFLSDVVQSFRKSVPYTINDAHTYKFTVLAQVVPVTLKLNKEEIEFKFLDDNLDLSVTEEVVINNSLNCRAEFKWFSRTPVFLLNPAEGIVEPFKTCPVQVTYKPNAPGRTEDSLILKVNGGPDVLLKVGGEIAEAKCIFQEKRIDLGKMAVGVSRDAKLTIRNTGPSDTVFWLETIPPDIPVSPQRGRILSSARTDVTVTIVATAAQLYEIQVIMNVRGGKTHKSAIFAEAVLPQVRVEQEEIDFGAVYLGVSAKQLVTLQNMSPVTAQLTLDLTENPQFTVVFSRDLAKQSAEVSGSLVDDEDSPISVVPIAPAAPDTPHSQQSADHPKGQIYQITIGAARNLPFHLVFTPVEVGAHEMELPLVVNGMGSSAGLRRVVAAEGVKPRLLLGTSIIDFGQRIVLKDRVKKPPYSLDLLITSNDSKPLHWDLDVSRLPEMFRLEPGSGVLDPGHAFKVRAYFTPKEAGLYSATVPLHLDKNMEKVYLELSLSGAGAHPTVDFDRRELLLPVVPLGFTSTTTFYVINQGYDNLELKYKLPADTTRVPVSVSFPEGTLIGIAKERIPVEVSFSSRKSMSFTAKIDFFDTEGNRFSIPVTGTTDNCLFTIYPYLHTHRDQYEWLIKDGRPISLIEKNPREGASKRGSVAKLAPLPKLEQIEEFNVGERTIRSLQRWLNGSVLKTPIQDIPGDLIANNGTVLVEIVEHLSGKQAPGKNFRLSNNRREAVYQLLNQFEDLLTFLKSHGALLNIVRPEHLLSAEDYQRLVALGEQRSQYQSTGGGGSPLFPQDTVTTPQQLQRTLQIKAPVRRFVPDKDFSRTSREAWCTVLFQLAKIFVLNRISVKQFRALPGMDMEEASSSAAPQPAVATQVGTENRVGGQAQVSNAPAGPPQSAPSRADRDQGAWKRSDPTLSSSNVYSVPENIILKWLTCHHNKINATSPRRVCNFDSDLRDGTVLAATIYSHVPTLPRLRTLRSKASTSEELETNAEKVSSALKELHLDNVISAHDILDANPRDLLLYCLYLYNVLPQFVPKTTIEFFTRLNEPQVKTIELTNPSNKLVNYSVRLTEGSPDFVINDELLKLEPKSQLSFPITFVARFSRTVTGRLVFTCIRAPGTAPASTMVFLLTGAVHSRKPLSQVKCESKVYELKQVEVPISNPYAGECDYALVVTQERVVEDVPANQRRTNPGGQTPAPEKNLAHPDPFWVKMGRIRLKEGESSTVSVSFIPFATGQYRCQLLFIDEKVGEFMHEVLGTGVLPESQDTFQCKCDANSQVTFDANIQHRNVLLDKARTTVMDLARQQNIARGIKDPVRDRDVLRKLALVEEQLVSSIAYRIEFQSLYFTSQDSVSIPAQRNAAAAAAANVAVAAAAAAAAAALPDGVANPSVSAKKAATPRGTSRAPDRATPLGGSVGTGREPHTRLPIVFHPKGPGVYLGRLILRSAYDIRVFDLEGTAVSPGTRVSLEFTCAARQTITQDIPVINNTDREFKINASVTGAFFGGPREIIVPPKSTVLYPLVFKPQWITESYGELILINSLIGERYVYELRGLAEEPLAEDHVIIECQARSTSKQRFRVLNIMHPPAEVTYRVESDLGVVTGEGTLTVAPKEEVDYELQIRPVRGGNYTGTLSFIAPNGWYMWYTVEVRAADPAPEKTITLRSQIRKAVAVEISIGNPLPEAVEFEVLLDGEGLLGDSVLTVPTSQVGLYELIFSPLQTGTRPGSVTFLNEKAGQFWFDLVLVGDPPLPVTLPELQCEIGQSTSTDVTLENPIGEAITLKTSMSNSRNFAVIKSPVTLPPYESIAVSITYTPTSLNELETGQVVFFHPQVGDWVFHCSGRGAFPSTQPETTVAAALAQTSSATIIFRNPFVRQIVVNIRLFSEEKAGVFALLLRKVSKLHMPALGTLQIPLAFAPERMAEHAASVVIEMEDGLSFVFPVRGIAEAPSSGTIFKYKCRARSRLDEVLEVRLSGLGPYANVKDDVFRHELIIPLEAQAMMKRALTITPLDTKIPAPDAPLRYQIVFEPLKPIRSTVDLVIYKSSGGRWRYDLQIEATDPVIDDVITIEAVLNKPSSISFRLTNQFPIPAPFTATFSPESPVEFSVSPTAGLLEPFGSQGSVFVITYTPTEYGKTLSGKLIIQTDDMQWTYEVRGTHPAYNAPKGETKLDTRLSANVEERLQQIPERPRNFLKENISKPLQKKKEAPSGFRR